MIQFNKLFFVLLIVTLQEAPQALYAQNVYPKDIEKKIQEVEKNLGLWVKITGDTNHVTLKERMNFYHVNGISIAVIKDYKVEWAKGYGWADEREKRPVNTNTRFLAGSISKSLNSIGVLKLAQDKKLDLYADINNYFSSWKFPYDAVSKGKKINSANLLSHTAGLNVHGFNGYEIGDTIPSLIQILDGIKPANTVAVRSVFEPGLKFQYSGGGTMISQLLVQDITKLPYEIYMKSNILDPIGMKNSSFSQPPIEKQNLLATGYYRDGKEVKGKYRLYPEQAAAGLWTSATDLAYFVIETQLSLKGKSNKVLSAEMTKVMLTPYIDRYAALGTYIKQVEKQTFFHNDGSDEGFVSQYYGTLGGGNGVVVMANTHSMAILGEIVNSVATVYGWSGFYKPQIKSVITVNNDTLKSYAGKYLVDNKSSIEISYEKDNLFLHQGNATVKLHFTTNTDFFFVEIPGSTFKFTKDSQNKVNALIQNKGSEVVNIPKVE